MDLWAQTAAGLSANRGPWWGPGSRQRGYPPLDRGQPIVTASLPRVRVVAAAASASPACSSA